MHGDELVRAAATSEVLEVVTDHAGGADRGVGEHVIYVGRRACIGVPIDEIARRAGVGAGTLYRHFPTKESLLEAVLLDHCARLAAEAQDAAESDEPAEALFAFMSRLSCAGTSRRDLIDALAGAGINVRDTPASLKADIEAALETLLKQAQEVGQVRADVTKEDLRALTMATCAFATQTEPGCSQTRMLHIVCDGLRPQLGSHR